MAKWNAEFEYSVTESVTRCDIKAFPENLGLPQTILRELYRKYDMDTDRLIDMEHSVV